MTLVAFDVDRMYSDEVQTHIFNDGVIKVKVPNTGINKIEVITSKHGFKLYLFMVGKCFNASSLIRWLRSPFLEELGSDEFQNLLVNFWSDRALRDVGNTSSEIINFILIPDLNLCYRLTIDDHMNSNGHLNVFRVNEMGNYALEGLDNFTANMVSMLNNLGRGNEFTPKERFAMNCLIGFEELGETYSEMEYKSGEVKTGLCTKALIKEVIPSLMKRSPMIKDLLSERYKQLDELKLKSPEVTKITESSNVIGKD